MFSRFMARLKERKARREVLNEMRFRGGGGGGGGGATQLEADHEARVASVKAMTELAAGGPGV